MDLSEAINAVPEFPTWVIVVSVVVGVLALAVFTKIAVALVPVREELASTTIVVVLAAGGCAFLAWGLTGYIARDSRDTQVVALIAEHVYDTYDLVGIAPADVTDQVATFEAADEDGNVFIVTATWRTSPASLVDGVDVPDVEPVTITIEPATPTS